MQNIQSYLTIGGLLLFSLTSLRFNNAILDTSTADVQNKVYLTAFSLADDMIEEIKVKSFDQNTIQFPTNDPSTLTLNLGPGSSEVYPNFNDVDDFNGYTRNVDEPHAEGYVVSCAVQYVQGNDPDVVSSTQTFFKKATVTVTSPYMDHAVSLSFIFTLK
ncbi:MAG: hypothetical protein WB779_14360 [Ignavibacteriaceae bacterium]|jgi:hypothetical protein